MKKFAMLFLTVFLLVSPLVLATNETYSMVEGISLQTTLVSQDPYPAGPGGYVELLFKVENEGSKKAENVVFELVPEYPFSLDPGASSIKELGTIDGQTGENAYLLKYKMRVDEDAIDGESEIRISYSYGSSAVAYSKTFGVDISDPKTDFEVVMQDYSSGSATFAIANIGTNTAYSLVVKIPDQTRYAISGASANVIGNLDAGDYTLASFSISSGFNATGAGFRRNPDQNTVQNTSATAPPSGPSEITLELSYTDELGIRRTVNKIVELEMTATSTPLAARAVSNSSSNGIGLLYIGIGAGGIAAIAVALKLWNRRKKK